MLIIKQIIDPIWNLMLFFENMNEHVLTLLEDIVSNPDKKIFELSIIK